MPSRPVQSLANGFLTLLGVKNLGKLPDTLLDEVRPTVGMEQWYLESNAQGVAGFTTPGVPLSAAVSHTFFTVPEGQLWYVHSLTVWVAVPVLPGPIEIRGLAAAIAAPHPYAWYMGSQIDQVIPVPTAFQSASRFFAPSLRKVWAPPGSLLTAAFATISAPDNLGAETYQLGADCRYTPLKV